MKKTCVIVAMLLILSACGGGGDAETLSANLVSRSTQQTVLMGSLAKSEEYADLFTPSATVKELMREIGKFDYSRPHTAVVLQVPDSAMGGYLRATAGEVGLRGEAYGVVERRMFTAIPSILIAAEGENLLVVTSILSVGQSYRQHDDFADNSYVILLYDYGYSSITTFVAGQEDTLYATSVFVQFSDALTGAIADRQIDQFLSDFMNLDGIAVDYFTGDDLSF